HFPPIPSVLIFDELLVPPFQAKLKLIPATSDDTSDIFDVEVRIWRELRLAIGPVDRALQPGALFEARTRVELAIEGNLVEVRRPWLYLNFPEEVEIRIDGRDCKGILEYLASDDRD